MTDRKFTPPTEFPAEYVTSDGRKAVIFGKTPDEDYPYVGWHAADGIGASSSWTKDGSHFAARLSAGDLHDLPKKQTHWANDYGDCVGHWSDSLEALDLPAWKDRIAVIRREWVEGEPVPQYFVEEV